MTILYFSRGNAGCNLCFLEHLAEVRCAKCQSLKPTTPLTGQDRCVRCATINELKPWIKTCQINPCYDGDLLE